MKLSKKAKEFLLEIYPFFLSLEKDDVVQYDDNFCFGAWIAFLYTGKGDYDLGVKKFLKTMGLRIADNLHVNENMQSILYSNKKYMDLMWFMKDCGAGLGQIKCARGYGNAFSGEKWNKQPHEVIRNMLEKAS